MPRAVNGIKQCSKCREFKPVEEFNKDSHKKDGLRSTCACCANIGYRRYLEENREKVLEYKRRYREKNREKLREKDRSYCEENREKIRERDRRYREENREKVLEQKRRNYAKKAAALKLCKDLNLID